MWPFKGSYRYSPWHGAIKIIKHIELFPKRTGSLELKVLSQILEALPQAILLFNAQGALQLANELGKVFLTLQQEAGREFKMVSNVQVPCGFLEPYVNPVFTGQQKNLGDEVELGWADGKHLYRVWVERLGGESEKTAGFIVVVRDITWRQQLESMQKQVKQEELSCTPTTEQRHKVGFIC